MPIFPFPVQDMPIFPSEGSFLDLLPKEIRLISFNSQWHGWA